MKRKQGIVAWLITCEAVGKHVPIQKEVAAVLNYRASEQRIREIVQMLWMHSECTPSDWLAWANSKKSYESQLLVGAGKISCGMNPGFIARKVDNLYVIYHEDGSEEVKWTERPGWQLDWKTRRRFKTGEAVECSWRTS